MQQNGVIERAPERLADERFDLIVVGGGIYGVMIVAESAARGLRALLVERADFGSGTSQNSLRIVHGGLRYLQSANLRRFRESVIAQRWFLRALPEFVTPLPCLMPLHDEGLYRRSLFRLALPLNELLAGPRPGLGAGRLAGADETRRIFPSVDGRGLRGGAIWYDACIPDTSRMLIEVLRSACTRGASALNHVEAVGLIEAAAGIEGVRALDRDSGRPLEFRAPVVINAAGPWSRSFSTACGAERPELFEPSIAWNLLFAREAPSDHAVAARARRRGAHTYFLVPWKGALLVGTGHAPWSRAMQDPAPTEEMLSAFIGELNEAVPELDLRQSEILRVFSGLLPVAKPGSVKLTSSEVFVDHGARGGPRGLFSVSGVKLTMAGVVANRVLCRVFPATKPQRGGLGLVNPIEREDHPLFWTPRPGDETWKEALRRAIADEAVLHLDDLLLRRSSLGDHPERALSLAPEVCRLFPWDAERSAAERGRLSDALGVGSRSEASEVSVGGC